MAEEPKQRDVRLVPGPGVSFWERAESLVMAALHDYATYAKNGRHLQRRLFAEDAVRGFAFVDLCHKRFDVVLMNPPFGESSKLAKSWIERRYPHTKNDVYAAFVERGLDQLNRGGFLGAITSRTGFFLSSFQKWREEILLGEASPTVFADLGHGVLDTAMVETAAYCVEARRGGGRSSFFRLLQTENKETALRTAVVSSTRGERAVEVFRVDPSSFRQVPSSPFAYWVSERVRRMFQELSPFESDGRAIRVGLQTGADFRFVRCWWEVPPHNILDAANGPSWRADVHDFRNCSPLMR